MTAPDIEGLVERLEKASGPDACWVWPRKLNDVGRGRVWIGDKLKLAHRAVWEIRKGPIPAGMMLCHTCDNPSCVNPNHLYVGTHRDNMRDMRERRRSFAATQPERVRELGRKMGSSNTWTRGEGNPKAKLTAEQAAAVAADPRPTRFLVADYGLHRTSIQRIRRGAQWARAQADEDER